MSHSWPNPKTKPGKTGKQAAYNNRKREEANIRQDAHNLLTTKEKMQKLDLGFGKGQGAIAERARLMLEIAKG